MSGKTSQPVAGDRRNSVVSGAMAPGPPLSPARRQRLEELAGLAGNQAVTNLVASTRDVRGLAVALEALADAHPPVLDGVSLRALNGVLWRDPDGDTADTARARGNKLELWVDIAWLVAVEPEAIDPDMSLALMEQFTAPAPIGDELAYCVATLIEYVAEREPGAEPLDADGAFLFFSSPTLPTIDIPIDRDPPPHLESEIRIEDASSSLGPRTQDDVVAQEAAGERMVADHSRLMQGIPAPMFSGGVTGSEGNMEMDSLLSVFVPDGMRMGQLLVWEFESAVNDGRPLTELEVQVARWMFGDSLDYDVIRFHGATARGHASGNYVYLSRTGLEYTLESSAAMYDLHVRAAGGEQVDIGQVFDVVGREAWRDCRTDVYVFLHELVHVWQFQHGVGPDLLQHMDRIAALFMDMGRSAPLVDIEGQWLYNWADRVDEAVDTGEEIGFGDLGFEQQAALVQAYVDWYVWRRDNPYAVIQEDRYRYSVEKNVALIEDMLRSMRAVPRGDANERTDQHGRDVDVEIPETVWRPDHEPPASLVGGSMDYIPAFWWILRF